MGKDRASKAARGEPGFALLPGIVWKGGDPKALLFLARQEFCSSDTGKVSRAVCGGELSRASASRPVPVLVLLETSLSLKSYQGYFKPECSFHQSEIL